MRKIACIFLAFGILLQMSVTGFAVGEKSSGEIKAEMQELEKQKEEMDKKITDLENKISDNMGEMEELVAQKANLEQQMTLLYEKQENINQQIQGYGVLIADKQEELNEAQNLLKNLREKNKERIRAMEERDTLTFWSVLFKAHSFSDLLDRLSMIEEIAASDQRRIQEMDTAAKNVEMAKSELEHEKKALETAKESLQQTQHTLEEKSEEVNEVLGKLLALGAEYDRLLIDAEEKTDLLMDSLAEKEAEFQKAKQQEYDRWLASQPPKPTAPSIEENEQEEATPAPGNDQWVVPIHYTTVSSPFGNRFHPVLNRWRMHSGIDLAAPTGTPIYASRSGVVSTVAYEKYGAGNYANINHMDGYVTRYMHMDRCIVSTGQKVVAGEIIGYCGDSGLCTGPHLHFGVYYNGKAINPAPFIGI